MSTFYNPITLLLVNQQLNVIQFFAEIKMNYQQTVLNNDLTEITNDMVEELTTSNNTSSVVHKFIKNYKSVPFDKYLQNNILSNAKNTKNRKLEVSEIKDVRVEAGYEFLFQIILIEDISMSVQRQLEILSERITGDVLYADKAKNFSKKKKQVKQLTEEEEDDNKDENNDADEHYQPKYRVNEQIVKIILQDQSGKYFKCIAIPDSHGLMKLSGIINMNCVPICKPILGTKITLKNFKYNRGAIILESDLQLSIYNNSHINNWNLNFYSKFINYWKNGLETRNEAKNKKLNQAERQKDRDFFASRA
ncbi:hypothetical protein QEN19_002041 [Hanseniaspora menglaensis]